MAFAIPLIPPAAEAITAGLIALGVIGGGVVVADQVQRARTRSRAATRDATTTACATCRNSPCTHLAAGTHGGAHGFMKGPAGDGLDSHHMPADSASPLPRDMGPAIRMTPADHAQTASHPSQPGSAAYRATQQRLIAGGNFAAAFAMDVADVSARFPGKYNVGIAQATAYMECLKRNGIVR